MGRAVHDVEALLDGFVRDGQREVRLAETGVAVEDEARGREAEVFGVGLTVGDDLSHPRVRVYTGLRVRDAAVVLEVEVVEVRVARRRDRVEVLGLQALHEPFEAVAVVVAHDARVIADGAGVVDFQRLFGGAEGLEDLTAPLLVGEVLVAEPVECRLVARDGELHGFEACRG